MKTGLEILDSPELSTHKELAGVMPELTAHEAEMLRESIVKAGVVYEPIEFFELDGQRIIVDGHHRYAIARAVGIPFRAVQLKLIATIEKAREHMFSVAPYRRRNLSKQKASYVRGLHFLQSKAQGKRLDKVAAAASKKSTSGQSGQKLVSEELARIYGVNGRRIRRDGEFARLVDQLKQCDPVAAAGVLDDECRVTSKDMKQAQECAAQAWSVVIGAMVKDRLNLSEACARVGTSQPKAKSSRAAADRTSAAVPPAARGGSSQAVSFFVQAPPAAPTQPPLVGPHASPAEQREAFQQILRDAQGVMAGTPTTKSAPVLPSTSVGAFMSSFNMAEHLKKLSASLPPTCAPRSEPIGDIAETDEVVDEEAEEDTARVSVLTKSEGAAIEKIEGRQKGKASPGSSRTARSTASL